MGLYSAVDNKLILLSFTTLILINFCNSCFIRNCPPGGKRSMDIIQRGTKQCMACGPDLRGQCVGTDICCGDFGCLMGTVESSVCAKENESTSPCFVSGEPCGSRKQGNCVATGLCCDSGACSFNSKCKTNSAKSSSELLSLLNRLLENREYSDERIS